MLWWKPSLAIQRIGTDTKRSFYQRAAQIAEWQKVALARAYMRHAPLLILDEPTAPLDARSTKGRMAVLISHRFSTVRMADRILVLKGGELVEQGMHEALGWRWVVVLGAVPTTGGRILLEWRDQCHRAVTC